MWSSVGVHAVLAPLRTWARRSGSLMTERSLRRDSTTKDGSNYHSARFDHYFWHFPEVRLFYFNYFIELVAYSSWKSRIIGGPKYSNTCASLFPMSSVYTQIFELFFIIIEGLVILHTATNDHVLFKHMYVYVRRLGKPFVFGFVGKPFVTASKTPQILDILVSRIVFTL